MGISQLGCKLSVRDPILQLITEIKGVTRTKPLRNGLKWAKKESLLNINAPSTIMITTRFVYIICKSISKRSQTHGPDFFKSFLTFYNRLSTVSDQMLIYLISIHYHIINGVRLFAIYDIGSLQCKHWCLLWVIISVYVHVFIHWTSSPLDIFRYLGEKLSLYTTQKIMINKEPRKTNMLYLGGNMIDIKMNNRATQIARLMGPTWGPPGSCRPQRGPMLAPWTLLSG